MAEEKGINREQRGNILEKSTACVYIYIKCVCDDHQVVYRSPASSRPTANFSAFSTRMPRIPASCIVFCCLFSRDAVLIMMGSCSSTLHIVMDSCIRLQISK